MTVPPMRECANFASTIADGNGGTITRECQFDGAVHRHIITTEKPCTAEEAFANQPMKVIVNQSFIRNPNNPEQTKEAELAATAQALGIGEYFRRYNPAIKRKAIELKQRENLRYRDIQKKLKEEFSDYPTPSLGLICKWLKDR